MIKSLTTIQIFEKIDQLQANNSQEISSIKLILENIIETQSKIQRDLRELVDCPRKISNNFEDLSDEKNPIQIIPEESNLSHERYSLSPITWTSVPSQDIISSENLDENDLTCFSDIPSQSKRKREEESKGSLVETPLKRWWKEIETETDSDEYCSWKSRHTI
jgi:hypothetical protein